MNAISYISGDPEITDFPERSARPLAAFVQSCNDLLAGPDGYLSPENSLLALELGWETMGTADVADTVIHVWVVELRWPVQHGALFDTSKTPLLKRFSISPRCTAGPRLVTCHPSPDGTRPTAPHAPPPGRSARR
jgi:hypothetical protein